MDESYLCKDVIILIISFIPSQYSTHVQLCRGVKSLLKTFSIDGYDALIAQGCSIEITSDIIKWYKNGLLHQGGDLPALIETCSGYSQMIWYQNGKIHRDGDRPAHIVRSINIIYHSMDIYYKDDLIHRDGDLPAHMSSYNRNLEWKIKGKRHRYGGPALFLYDSTVEFWLNGEYHRDDGPAYIYKDRNHEIVRWHTNGTCVRPLFVGDSTNQMSDLFIYEKSDDVFCMDKYTFLLERPDYFDEILKYLNPHGSLRIISSDGRKELRIYPSWLQWTLRGHFSIELGEEG